MAKISAEKASFMERLMATFKFLKKKWNEPSTHASLSVLCTSAGVQLPDTTIGHVFVIGGVAFGALGIWFNEAEAKTEV